MSTFFNSMVRQFGREVAHDVYGSAKETMNGVEDIQPDYDTQTCGWTSKDTWHSVFYLIGSCLSFGTIALIPLAYAIIRLILTPFIIRVRTYCKINDYTTDRRYRGGVRYVGTRNSWLNSWIHTGELNYEQKKQSVIYNCIKAGIAFACLIIGLCVIIPVSNV